MDDDSDEKDDDKVVRVIVVGCEVVDAVLSENVE